MTETFGSCAPSRTMYQRGDAIQAKWGQEWYASKVVEVSEQEPRWLVHYQGWNSRFDEWLPSACVRRSADGAPPASTPAARAPRPAKSAARQQLEASGPRSSASGAQVHTTLSELLAAGKLQPGPIVLDHHRSRPTHITVEAKLLAHHSGVASRASRDPTPRERPDAFSLDRSGAIEYDGATHEAPGGFVAAALEGHPGRKCNPYHVLYLKDGTSIQSLRTRQDGTPILAGHASPAKKTRRDAPAPAKKRAAPAPAKRTPAKQAKRDAPPTWAPTAPRDARRRLGLPALPGDDAGGRDDAWEAFRRVSVVTDEGDARQSDRTGRGVLFAVGLARGAAVADPSVAYFAGPAPRRLSPYEYIQYADGYFLLRDGDAGVTALTYYINEARGRQEPNVRWSVHRPASGGLVFRWELLRAVRPDEEILASYVCDASGVAKRSPDPRRGASLVQRAPRRPPAATPERRPAATPRRPTPGAAGRGTRLAAGARVQIIRFNAHSARRGFNGARGAVVARRGRAANAQGASECERYDVKLRDSGVVLELVSARNLKADDDDDDAAAAPAALLALAAAAPAPAEAPPSPGLDVDMRDAAAALTFAEDAAPPPLVLAAAPPPLVLAAPPPPPVASDALAAYDAVEAAEGPLEAGPDGAFDLDEAADVDAAPPPSGVAAWAGAWDFACFLCGRDAPCRFLAAPALRGRGPGAVARYGAYRGAASLGAALAAGGLVADVVVDLGLGYCAVDRGALDAAWRAFSRASVKP